jgi:hypothetical protein
MGTIERYYVERGIYVSPFLWIYPHRFLKSLLSKLKKIFKERLLSH